MNNLWQSIETLFGNAAVWGANLPQYLLVPLVMILAMAGTIVVVSLIMGLIRLTFGQKAIDFIKDIPQRLNNAAGGVDGSRNGQ